VGLAWAQEVRAAWLGAAGAQTQQGGNSTLVSPDPSEKSCALYSTSCMVSMDYRFDLLAGHMVEQQHAEVVCTARTVFVLLLSQVLQAWLCTA
jgi:hypothetical protein